MTLEFTCWIPGGGESEQDGRVVKAVSAQGAAFARARDPLEEAKEEEAVEVHVRAPSGDVTKWHVWYVTARSLRSEQVV